MSSGSGHVNSICSLFFFDAAPSPSRRLRNNALKEAHPVRLKKIYIVHAAWFVNQAVAIVKPFIKTELMSLLHFTTGGPDEIFPPETLPEVTKQQ